MTTKKSEIERLAMLIALEAPATNSAGRHTTYVRWKLVEQLRAAIDAAGYDFKAMRKNIDELRERQERPGRIKGLRDQIAATKAEIAHLEKLGYGEDQSVLYGASLGECRRRAKRCEAELAKLLKLDGEAA